MQSCVGGALGHRYGSAHVDAGVYGAEGGQRAQRVAADVGKDLCRGVVGEHLVEGDVYVSVAAPLAQCGRSGHNPFGYTQHRGLFYTHRRCHIVGVEFSGSRQVSRKAAFDRIITADDAAELLLKEWLAVLHHKDRVAAAGELAHPLRRDGVLRDLHDVESGLRGAVLHHIVVSRTACDDSFSRGVLRQEDLEEGVFARELLQKGLFCSQCSVLAASVGRQQNP